MTIAEKIARAKADFDEVFESGQKSVLSVLDFTDTESSAYRITVPSNADPFARVNKIGGMTHKTKNLIPPSTRKSYTNNGITYTVNDDGSIVANGTATAESNFEMFRGGMGEKFSLEQGKTYTVSGAGSGGSTTTYRLIVQDSTYHQTADSGSSFVANYTDYYAYIRIYSGYVADNLTFYPMLNEGSTALPFEPYFEGLRSAEVTELKSEFGNLFNYDNIIDKYKGTGENEGKIWVNSTGFSSNFYTGTTGSSTLVPREYWNKLMYLTKGTYYAYYDIDFYENDIPETDRFIQARAIHLNGTDFWCGQGGQKLYSGGSFTMYEDGYCYLRSGINKRCYISNLMITRTPTDTYIPYKYESIPIPEAIKSLEGYGLGKNADEYNYIDFDNKIFKSDYRKVRLPKIGYFNADVPWYAIDIKSLGISPLTRSVLCNLLPSVDIQADHNAEGIYLNSSIDNVVIRKSGFTTAEEYRQWLSDNEVYIIERIAEPIETDISEYLTDKYIQVEGGGTITAVNEHQLDAPTNISYLLDTQGG